MLKVTETTPESVKVILRGGKAIEGTHYETIDDFTYEVNGIIIHLGGGFLINGHFLPNGVIDRVVAKQIEVRDVVVYGQKLGIRSKED